MFGNLYAGLLKYLCRTHPWGVEGSVDDDRLLLLLKDIDNAPGVRTFCFWWRGERRRLSA